MSNIWLDTLNYNISKAHRFFKPKDWSEEHNEIWLDALQWAKVDQINESFKIWYRQGKYMPKPADIVKIINDLNPIKPPSLLENKQEKLPECNKTIQSAWIRFNKLQNDFDFPYVSKVEMTDDQAILICNMEAKRIEIPSAIKKEFWLTDVWGEMKKEKTDAEIMEDLKKDRIDSGPVPKYKLSTIS